MRPVDVPRQAPSKRRKVSLAIVIGAITLGLAFLTMHRASAAAIDVERGSVWTERVHRGDLLRQVPVQGVLVPERIEWLSAVSAARVSRIAVRPGAVVEPDTVVVVLENAELELAALEAERQAASAESGLIQLDVRTDVDRKAQASNLGDLRSSLREAENHARVAARLVPEGLINEMDHRDALNKVHGLRGRVEIDEGRLRTLESGRGRQLTAQRKEIERLVEIAKFRRRQLASLTVRAGIRGILQEIPLQSGQWVAIGTLLAKVSEPDHLKAEVKVGEGYAKDVYRGLAVRFESPAGNFRGHIERVDPTVMLGSVRLEVALDDGPPKGSRADQTVSGYVEIERLDNVLFVARPAGARDGATTRVFRFDGDHVHASRVTTQLGRGSARDVEVVGGLAEGDEIVVSETSAWEAVDRIRLK